MHIISILFIPYTKSKYKMKRLFALMVLMTCFVHAEEPGSQFLKAAESGDRRAQYFLADTV